MAMARYRGIILEVVWILQDEQERVGLIDYTAVHIA